MQNIAHTHSPCFVLQNTKCETQNAKYKIQSTEHKIKIKKYKIQNNAKYCPHPPSLLRAAKYKT